MAEPEDKPVRDRIAWEWRIIRRSWSDTWLWIKGLGLGWDLALFLVPPALAWILGGPEMTIEGVFWAVGVGWGGALIVLATRGIWDYIWTPFRLDREQRRTLQRERQGGASNTALWGILKDEAVFLKVICKKKADEYKVSIVSMPGGTHGSTVYPKSLPWDQAGRSFVFIATEMSEVVRLGAVKFFPPREHYDPVFTFIPAVENADPLHYKLARQEVEGNYRVIVPVTIAVQAKGGKTERHVVTFDAEWHRDGPMEAKLAISVEPGPDHPMAQRGWTRETFEGPGPTRAIYITTDLRS